MNTRDITGAVLDTLTTVGDVWQQPTVAELHRDLVVWHKLADLDLIALGQQLAAMVHAGMLTYDTGRRDGVLVVTTAGRIYLAAAAAGVI